MAIFAIRAGLGVAPDRAASAAQTRADSVSSVPSAAGVNGAQELRLGTRVQAPAAAAVSPATGWAAVSAFAAIPVRVDQHYLRRAANEKVASAATAIIGLCRRAIAAAYKGLIADFSLRGLACTWLTHDAGGIPALAAVATTISGRGTY